MCVCRQTLWSLQGSVSEDALPEWRSLRELRTQRFLHLPTWIPGWALASPSAWITDQLSISGDSIISDECQDMVNNCVQQTRVKQKPHSGPIKNKMGGRVAALGCFSCCSWTQPYLSTQGRSVRSTSTSARATLATTEAPASTSRMASPVTVHLGGWGPAVRSVSQPVRCRLFSYSSKTWHMESFMPLCVCVCVCVCVCQTCSGSQHTLRTPWPTCPATPSTSSSEPCAWPSSSCSSSSSWASVASAASSTRARRATPTRSSTTAAASTASSATPSPPFATLGQWHDVNVWTELCGRFTFCISCHW